MKAAPTLAAERELLVTQCELDRLELALAWTDVRRAIHPSATNGDEAHADCASATHATRERTPPAARTHAAGQKTRWNRGLALTARMRAHA